MKSSEILFGKQCLVQGVIWVDPSDHLDIDTSRYFTNHSVSDCIFFFQMKNAYSNTRSEKKVFEQ